MGILDSPLDSGRELIEPPGRARGEPKASAYEEGAINQCASLGLWRDWTLPWSPTEAELPTPQLRDAKRMTRVFRSASLLRRIKMLPAVWGWLHQSLWQCWKEFSLFCCLCRWLFQVMADKRGPTNGKRLRLSRPPQTGSLVLCVATGPTG